MNLLEPILAYLLHSANRNIKGKSEKFISTFYLIKDKILKRGKWVGYDVQHIKGKKCNSCGGTGLHARYSNTPPYKPYDYDDCYHCFAGWYKMPLWICLRRIQFGKYVFHKPLKREEHIGNPFTQESLGWEVSSNPVIEGYIEHEKHWFGGYAIFIIFLLYNRPIAKAYFNDEFYWWYGYRLRNFVRRFRSWNGWTIVRPKVKIRQYYDEDFKDPYYDDLPF
jgi:hypothetical protein